MGVRQEEISKTAPVQALAMAYNYLSAILEVGTKENVAKAFDIWNEYVETMNEKIEENEALDILADDDSYLGFHVEEVEEDTELWIYSEKRCLIDNLIKFVIKLGQELKLRGKWGFEFGGGGGAAVIDLETGTFEKINTDSWLREKLGK
jgi:hypothetical protein